MPFEEAKLMRMKGFTSMLETFAAYASADQPIAIVVWPNGGWATYDYNKVEAFSRNDAEKRLK